MLSESTASGGSIAPSSHESAFATAAESTFVAAGEGEVDSDGSGAAAPSSATAAHPARSAALTDKTKTLRRRGICSPYVVTVILPRWSPGLDRGEIERTLAAGEREPAVIVLADADRVREGGRDVFGGQYLFGWPGLRDPTIRN